MGQKSEKHARRAQSSNRKGIRSERALRKSLLAVGILLAVMVRYLLLLLIAVLGRQFLLMFSNKSSTHER